MQSEPLTLDSVLATLAEELLGDPYALPHGGMLAYDALLRDLQNDVYWALARLDSLTGEGF